jgi:hypothetical protein
MIDNFWKQSFEGGSKLYDQHGKYLHSAQKYVATLQNDFLIGLKIN